MTLKIESDLKDRFLGLEVLLAEVLGVSVSSSSSELNIFRSLVEEETRRRYKLETLKDQPVFRAYRDFFWRAGIDPTKVRPAAEALIRRILGGGTIPRINNVVDSYNLASIRSEVALASFDEDLLTGDLVIRTASEGETFLGIGMKASMRLKGGEIVVSDQEKLIAIYPYRDADTSKVSEKTKNLLLMICGVPGVDHKRLMDAANMAIEFVTRYCGGQARLL